MFLHTNKDKNCRIITTYLLCMAANEVGFK